MAHSTGDRHHHERHHNDRHHNDLHKVRERAFQERMDSLKDDQTFHHEDAIDDAYTRQINEGRQRLARPRPQQFITGFMGGLEIGLGILAGVAVMTVTGSQLLGGLAFSFGFVILLLAHSELFTEGFLVPTSVVIARRAHLTQLIRFWFWTFMGNLVGGFVVMGFMFVAFPGHRDTVGQFGAKFADLSPTPENICLSVMAGMAITLMTRMQIGTDEVVGKIVAAMFGGLLLFGVGMLHSVLDTLLLFGAIFDRASDASVLSILKFLWWVIPLNMFGGIVGVAFPRALQARDRIRVERLRVARDLLAGDEFADDARGALKTGHDVRNELQQEVLSALKEQKEKEKAASRALFRTKAFTQTLKRMGRLRRSTRAAKKKNQVTAGTENSAATDAVPEPVSPETTEHTKEHHHD